MVYEGQTMHTGHLIKDFTQLLPEKLMYIYKQQWQSFDLHLIISFQLKISFPQELAANLH